MLKFKPSITINAQLLRLAAWFSQYSFDVTNIKGKDNIIPDFLSRPSINIITTKHKTIPFIFNITKTPDTMSSAYSPNLVAMFPPTFPKDAEKITLSDDPRKKAINHALKIQNVLIRIYGESMV